MRVLIITRHYLDEQLGGPNCSKAFVKALSELYDDCTLIYPEHDDHNTDLHFVSNAKLLPCYDKRHKLFKGLDMYRGKIHRLGAFAIKELRSNRYDIVFIDHSVAAAGIIKEAVRRADKVVTLHHNVESEYIRDNQQSILFRLPYNYFALKAERDSIIMSSLNLTLTDDDTNKFASLYPSVASRIRTMGMFLYDNEEDIETSKQTDNSFVISGSLGASQTETAILAFLNECLPVLDKVCPDNRLVITGRNPSSRILSACKGHKNITVKPNPADILAEIRKANYYIAPIHTGGGLKLRIMDGLRLGLPVIAHKMATRGYEPIIADGFMYEYSDAHSFEVSLRKMLDDTSRSHEQVALSFMKHFSFNAGKERLKKILQDL